MSQTLLASTPDSNLPAFSFVSLTSFSFSFLNLKMLSYQAANVAQQRVSLFLKKKRNKCSSDIDLPAAFAARHKAASNIEQCARPTWKSSNRCLLGKDFGQFCLSIFVPLSKGCKTRSDLFERERRSPPTAAWSPEAGWNVSSFYLPHVKICMSLRDECFTVRSHSGNSVAKCKIIAVTVQ